MMTCQQAPEQPKPEVLSYLLKGESVTVVFSNGPKTISKGQTNYDLVLEALKKNELDKLHDLINIPKAVKTFTQGKVEIVDDKILFEGEEVKGYIVTKVFDLMGAGLPFEHLLRFLERLMKNPSKRARDELYKFLETENLPVTEDGCFLAYKSIRGDNHKDWHSNSIDNSVGRVVEMPREEVDDNQSRGCSAGLHVGSMSYVRNFGGYNSVMVICKVDPADVVCIPSEDVRKIRCCKYEVVSHFTEEFSSPVYDASGTSPLSRPADDFDVDVEDDDWEDEAEEEDNDSDWCRECGEELGMWDNYCPCCGTKR